MQQWMKHWSLVGYFGNMSAHVATALSMLAENQLTSSCCQCGDWICGWVWCVMTRLPSHINDLLGHYYGEDTSHIWRKTGINMYINEHHTLFVTFLHWIMPLQHDFLWSFAIFLLCPKNQPTCWLMSCQHEKSCHMGWSGQQKLMMCWPNILDMCWPNIHKILQTWQHICNQHVIFYWGGLLT